VNPVALGAVHCGDEHEDEYCHGPGVVFYGSGDQWTSTELANGESIHCGNAAIGCDPVPGWAKDCYILQGSSSAQDWPAGTYCIMTGAAGSCPNGFQSGYRHQDNEDDDNTNEAWGARTPSGFGGRNSDWHFCCRADGTHSNQAVLPGTGTHTLPTALTTFKKGGQCQQFERYQTGVSLWIYWDDEDDNNANSHSGSLPDGQYDRNTKFEVCVHIKTGASSNAFEQRTGSGPSDHHVINLDDPELDPEPFAFRIRVGDRWIAFKSMWQPVMALVTLILFVVSMAMGCVLWRRRQRAYVAVKYMDSEPESESEIEVQPINN